MNQRYASVDALRGLCVAAMLLVNNPGDWGDVYAPLQHAAWHGCTPTDLIFPFFLFIVGVSLSLALGPRVEAGDAIAPLRRAVLIRALRILLLGLALHALAWWLMDKPHFRLMGVLQRIAICFALTGLAALVLRPRHQWGLLLTLLLGWGLLLLSGASMDKASNIAARADSSLLGPLAYEWGEGRAHEPEGLLSTLGAWATTMLGLRVGAWLRERHTKALLAAGLFCLLAGWLWSLWQPMNKQLWTPSFMLWSGGVATLTLLLAQRLIDQRGWPALGRSFGVNAITAYAGAWVMSVVLAALGWQTAIYQDWLLPTIGAALGAQAASLAFSLAFVALWWLLMRLLDRHRIYIKV
ncbi:heparan-alpha-glucosaminide N-acetyltransferase domain-containing protein [Paucibacter sp. PLA-PC-4]|uniref:acyltransferase family protein n=1 Tax=Paucibacter sp. PLA-PC-4 TaxID=2993655 RepID=UPI00224942D9|nr:heparan-alpha-glucosaminide N-acetyltransferase domain-containing protein [Paucibacter sp. PLA-PC-4]MCX2860602.1 heparan-alpha-glucosaminide N-acetyltransferase domain-containing protein [Paucibacter sp. PLA-PC-4]